MNKLITTIILLSFVACQNVEENSSIIKDETSWILELHQPDTPPKEVMTFENGLFSEKPNNMNIVIDDFEINIKIILLGNHTVLELKTTTQNDSAESFLSLRCNYEKGDLFTFSGKKEGKEVFRQSPHDPKDHRLDMAKEAIPMVALKTDNGFIVALSDQPGHCNNYTTQEIDTHKKTFSISSGDEGKTPGYKGKSFSPYYQKITKDSSHTFRIVAFRSKANEVNKLRNDAFVAIDLAWGSRSGSKYHALCFSSNYMHYRKNETGYSKYWVVPGIKYANKQYTRDAFWQSMMFPLAMEQQCYDAIYPDRYTYAENAMIYVIWSYRLHKRGGNINKELLKDALEYIESNTLDGQYFASERKRPSFKSWYDLCAFEKDDVISYNQGLLVVALKAAKALGVPSKIEISEAQASYANLYKQEGGYIPLSKLKDGLCVDALVGDVLSILFFDESILPDDYVINHYQTVVERAKTPYGIKVTSAVNGDYAPLELYMAGDYIESGFNSPGAYQWGGSWYLYEMLFHIGGYLHNAENAENNLIERGAIDFKIGGTYYEYVNTVTGEPSKANQGWNASIYAIWKMLIAEGKATDRFIKEMDALL